jgi:CRISPR-associated protein Cmr2
MVSLGPVQDFIAQARRTRDLWYGSFLLSELSKVAAKALAERGQLVFPALDAGDERLEPREDPKDAFNVANKIVALVPAGDAESAAQAARDASLDALRRRGDSVRDRCREMLADVNTLDVAWDEQIESFLEVAACWAPVPEGDDGYGAARRQVEAVLAARKTLREFEPWRQQRGAVPKSTLDGARETVLCGERDVTQRPWRTYRIAEGEQLDAVGLLKRAGGKPEQFIPIANVAAAKWLLSLEREAKATLEELRAVCDRAHEDDRLDGMSGRFKWTKLFPYDVELLRKERWPAIEKERGLEREWLETHVGPAAKELTPPTYVACLVADGDHMGNTIEALRTSDAHRDLSRVLAEFAQEDARRVVEKDHDGLLVYAGGDDVLAFVCVQQAVACADALRVAFERRMRSLALPAGVDHPTLSVGVVIGHVQEHMGELLREGRQAEQDAKRDRNALAVRVVKRSGGTLTWRRRWDDALNPAQAIAAAQARLADKSLSVKKVFAVRDRLRRFDLTGRMPGAQVEAADRRALALDVWGTLRHGRHGDAERASFKTYQDAGLDFDPLGTLPDDVRARLEDWSACHLVARELQRLAKGRR